jgi:DNA-binding NtrC family response regulator
MTALKMHPWPGNIRELSNTIQKALIFNRGAPIRPEDISQVFNTKNSGRSVTEAGELEPIRLWARRALASGGRDNLFDACMDSIAGILISEALNLTAGNRSRAAKLLGLSRPTLHSKIEKYELKIETSVK